MFLLAVSAYKYCIAEMDEYWGDDGDAPEWRRQMGIGKRIK